MEPTTLTDTIIVFVRDSVSQAELIGAYQELVESQSSTYQLLVPCPESFAMEFGNLFYAA